MGMRVRDRTYGGPYTDTLFVDPFGRLSIYFWSTILPFFYLSS